MPKTKKKTYLLWSAIVLVILLTGCGPTKVKEDKPEAEQQEKGAHKLSDKDKNIITEDIKSLFAETWDPQHYRIDNISVQFLNEQDEGDKTSVDANVSYTMTLIRNPADSPLIRGMKEALAKIKPDDERKIAQDMIDGYLKEKEPEFNQEQQLSLPLKVEVTNNGNDDLEYQLLYPVTNGEEITLHPAREYFLENFKEDEAAQEKMGEDMINEEITRAKG
ncbi:hypothetical protein [Paenibacillus solani]|uniref:hypothetical protein n=1 Tax=Paenibacillus solani TaxID=1705565 RepID=UPI003D2DD0B5